MAFLERGRRESGRLRNPCGGLLQTLLVDGGLLPGQWRDDRGRLAEALHTKPVLSKKKTLS